MAKIVLTINANNKATESVRHLNKEIGILKSTLPTIQVNRNLTAQINALTKHYTALAKAAVRVNEATTKRQIAEQRLVNEVKRGRTEDQRTLKVKAQKEQAELRLKQAQDKATQSTQKQTTATKQNTEVNKEHRQSILSMTRGILEWQIATTLVMKPLRALQDALASINETLVKTEDSVIALQRVLPSGSATDGEISSRLYKIAQDYGQTFDNVSQIAENFARTGMSWVDTIKATEAAVLALNVAELDATEASEGLISIITQFDMSTAQLTETVDKLNKAADNNPVTTEKLLKALQRTGAAAKNANINLDDTIGIITTLSKATNRSGENLGTAVNSLIQFSSKASSLKVFKELGGDVATAVEKYQAGAGSILEIWEELGEVIKDRQGNAESILGGGLFSDEDWAGLNEELKEALGESYADITDIYDTASTFRKNYFIALLNDMENVKKVSGEIANANGYSQDENQKYLDTYTAKLNTLKAQWEDIANSEQGLLGIKKAFVDIGSALLTANKWTGGLRTTIMAVATALTFLVGDKVVSGIVKVGKSFKSITSPLNNFTKAVEASRAAKQASLAATEAQNTADAIRNGQLIEGITLEQADKNAKELQTIATQKATVATQAWGVAIKTALGIIGLFITGVSMLVGIIDSIDQNKAQEQAEWISKVGDETGKAVEKLSDLQDAIDGTIKAYSDYADKVEEARKILSDENSTTEEVTAAKNTLNEIQKTLVESNSNYADSIDVVNGKLAEQLNLLEKLGEEQARKQVHDYLEKNSGAIYDANKYLTDKHTEIKFEEAVGGREGLFKDAPLEAWLKSLGYDASEQAGLGEGLGSLFTNSKVFKTTLFHDGMTLDEQLAFLKELRAEAAKIADEETRNYIDSQLNKAEIAITSTDAYKQSDNLINGNANSSNWIERLTLEQLKQIDNGDLTIEQVKKLLGLEQDVSDEVANQTNDIFKLSTKYKDIISSLKEMRDLTKESTEWEEKKLAVMEAEQALENARNEATVRRFNQATGQWEWQTDEKKIAEAEKNLEQAQLNLQEAAYDNIIEQLEKGDATNESILAILKEVAPLLGEDFSNAVQNAIKDKTGVDITKPAISNFDAAQNYINEKGLKESDREKWTEDKTFEKLFNALTDEEKSKLKGKSYDSGGIANGLGFMAKATAQPETVNDPELTRKILSPVSNAEFNRYVRDRGIMFERSHQYAQAPVIERVGGAVDNRVNNSGQINFAGGLTVGAEQRGSSIDQVLAMFGIMNNNG